MAGKQLISQAGEERPEAQGKAPYVVGIGASAGGLQPLQEFFGSMPQDSGLAFLIVQHLSPEFKSLMSELLSRHTNMALHRVEHGMPLEPDSIYLIPPKKNVAISDGKLFLTDQDLTRGHPLNFPIDIFLNSLAEQFGRSGDRRDPVGDRQRRDARRAGDQRSRRGRAGAGPGDGRVRRHAAECDRAPGWPITCCRRASWPARFTTTQPTRRAA